jgi:hypothetical protein
MLERMFRARFSEQMRLTRLRGLPMRLGTIDSIGGVNWGETRERRIELPGENRAILVGVI